MAWSGKVVTQKMARQVWQCSACDHACEWSKLARLPDSGGEATLACPECKCTNIKRRVASGEKA